MNASESRDNKPSVNHIARIVNSHFLQSPYEGKDWESVRKDLIEELTAHTTQPTNRSIERARVDGRIFQLEDLMTNMQSLDSEQRKTLDKLHTRLVFLRTQLTAELERLDGDE